MSKILQEGLTLKEIAVRCKKYNVPLYSYPNFGGTEETIIVKAMTVQNIKIWLPKKERKIYSEIDKKKIASMELKKMVMYNGEEAYF